MRYCLFGETNDEDLLNSFLKFIATDESKLADSLLKRREKRPLYVLNNIDKAVKIMQTSWVMEASTETYASI